jgi:hypothetical protein
MQRTEPVGKILVVREPAQRRLHRGRSLGHRTSLHRPPGRNRPMRSTPLNYLSADTSRWRWRRWPWRTVTVVALVLLLVAAAQTVAVRRVESRIDAVTGSMTWKTVWLFGITSGPRVDVSPLETRLKTSGIAWTPSWRGLHNTYRNAFGRAICYECGSAPPIYQLRPVLQEFAAASTDAELREFVRVMQSGTEAEQEAAVNAAAEKELQAP